MSSLFACKHEATHRGVRSSPASAGQLLQNSVYSCGRSPSSHVTCFFHGFKIKDNVEVVSFSIPLLLKSSGSVWRIKQISEDCKCWVTPVTAEQNMGKNTSLVMLFFKITQFSFTEMWEEALNGLICGQAWPTGLVAAIPATKKGKEGRSVSSLFIV